MLNILEELLIKSELITLFDVRRKDDYTNTDKDLIVSYRVKSNIYRIRAFEFFKGRQGCNFRVYYSEQIDEILKNKFDNIDGVIGGGKRTTDYYKNDYMEIAIEIKNILKNSEIINKCKNNSIAKTSKFEGLELPDVDVSQDEIMGQVFSWREIISIWEDNTEENNLKKLLSRNGVYIQRDKTGKSRYVGSAYGENGIIGRWMKHLESNGNAKYLNLFVLENGYNEMLFSVIEFYDRDDIIKRENMWKAILGTVNYSGYNGMQLNNN